MLPLLLNLESSEVKVIESKWKWMTQNQANGHHRHFFWPSRIVKLLTFGVVSVLSKTKRSNNFLQTCPGRQKIRPRTNKKPGDSLLFMPVHFHSCRHSIATLKHVFAVLVPNCGQKFCFDCCFCFVYCIKVIQIFKDKQGRLIKYNRGLLVYLSYSVANLRLILGAAKLYVENKNHIAWIEKKNKTHHQISCNNVRRFHRWCLYSHEKIKQITR